MSKLPFVLTWDRPVGRPTQGHMRFVRGRPILHARSWMTNLRARALPYASRLLDPSFAPERLMRHTSFHMDSPATALTISGPGWTNPNADQLTRPTGPPSVRQTPFDHASSRSRWSTPSARWRRSLFCTCSFARDARDQRTHATPGIERSPDGTPPPTANVQHSGHAC